MGPMMIMPLLSMLVLMQDNAAIRDTSSQTTDTRVSRCIPDVTRSGTHLTAGGSPVTVTIVPSDETFVWTDSVHIAHIPSHRQFKVRVDHLATYTIEAQSEDQKIAMALIRGCDVIQAWGEDAPDRYFRERLITLLDPSIEYRVLVGSGDALPTKVRVGVFQEGERMKPDPARGSSSLNVREITQGVIESGDEKFAGYRADFYTLPRFPENRWIRVAVSSGRIDPALYALDSSDLIIVENDDRRRGDTSAELVLTTNKLPTSIAVSYASGSDTLGAYKISVRSYPYDPSLGFGGMLGYYFANPLFAFLAGLAASIVLSQLFFKKQFRTRRIVLSRFRDDLVINEDPDESEPLLRVAKSEEPLRCASLVSIEVTHGGHVRIGSDLVREPLHLSLIGVKRILTFRYTTPINDAWESPQIVENRPDTLLLPFRILDPGDRITLSILCEQTSAIEIHPHLHGQIAETVISQPRTKLEYKVWRLAAINTGIQFVFVLLLSIDGDLLPRWISMTMALWLIISGVAVLPLFFATSSGRETVRDLIRAILPNFILSRGSGSVKEAGKKSTAGFSRLSGE